MTDGWSEELQVGRFVLLSALLGSTLFALLALLHGVRPDLVRRGTEPWPAEVYAGSVALAYLVVTAINWRRKQLPTSDLIPIGTAVFVGLVWIGFLRECRPAAPHYDFGCYYRAGEGIVRGANIYFPLHIGGKVYIYSPLVATVLAGAYALPESNRLLLSYWIWGAANYWSLMMFLPLCVAALRLYGVRGRWLWPAVGAAFVCNIPIQRTLIFSQVNFHVMNLILGFLLLYRARPAMAGALLGTAAMLKSSPGLLLVLVIAERRWKAALGFLLGVLGIAAISVAIVGSMPWIEFVQSVSDIGSHGVYRDNSVQSLFISVAAMAGIPETNRLLRLSAVLAAVAGAVMFLYMAFSHRDRSALAAEQLGLAAGGLPAGLMAMVIISPLIWEHHWVFAQLPFLLLLARAWQTPRFPASLLCYALVFMVPTFDVFPLSYHRLAGLLGWAILVHRMETTAPML